MGTVLRGAACAGLLAIVALTGSTHWFAQIPTGAQVSAKTAQYCAPQEEIPDAHKFYCGYEHGRTSADAHPAA